VTKNRSPLRETVGYDLSSLRDFGEPKKIRPARNNMMSC
jgi:hypothetical protein